MLSNTCFALLLVSAAVFAYADDSLPCHQNLCPSGYTCDIATQLCLGSGSGSGSGAGSCVDTFQGKGNCAQFRRKGFCGHPRKDVVKKYCARTCNMC
uniref:ShKT domain-containing protein n=1 Tax=Steinernema glaseri TaxID=37863 RepID=A0A1I8ABJ4_9BILA